MYVYQPFALQTFFECTCVGPFLHAQTLLFKVLPRSVLTPKIWEKTHVHQLFRTFFEESVLSTFHRGFDPWKGNKWGGPKGNQCLPGNLWANVNETTPKLTSALWASRGFWGTAFLGERFILPRGTGIPPPLPKRPIHRVLLPRACGFSRTCWIFVWRVGC